MKKAKQTVEERAFLSHTKLLTKLVGKKRAENANIGWGVSEDEWGLSISTKVYGEPTLVFTTKHDKQGRIVGEKWRDYFDFTSGRKMRS